jgi:hypothetical protein
VQNVLQQAEALPSECTNKADHTRHVPCVHFPEARRWCGSSRGTLLQVSVLRQPPLRVLSGLAATVPKL